MSSLTCFLSGGPAPHECNRAACTACAEVVQMLAALDDPQPRGLEAHVPLHVLRAARRVSSSSRSDD